MSSARSQDETPTSAPVYQILAEDLKAMGVDTVFGLMSDDTAHLGVSIDAAGIRFIGARHENVGISMAEGYAAATGRLGVALVGRGPALANGLHGAIYASRTGAPLLTIYGEAALPAGPGNGIGPDYKALDQAAVLRAAGIRVFLPSGPETARQMLADAAAAAIGGQAVALLLPVNVQRASMARPDTPPRRVAAEPFAPAPGSPADAKSVTAAAAVLAGARKPLILAGRGAWAAGAREQLIALAEQTGALLATTAKAKDMFRGHPWNLGIIGSFSHAMARRLAAEADCLLAVGAGLNFLTTSYGEILPPAPLIQIDALRSSIGRWTAADVGLVGDAALVAQQLCDAVTARRDDEAPFRAAETLAAIAAFDIAADFEPADTARTVDPRSLGVALNRLLPERRNMVYDAGNFLGVLPYLDVPDPAHIKLTSDFASLGMSFGPALGFARARPDETTVLVIGDGGFMMTLGDLETVVREDLPLVIVVMNDCAYGAELHFLRLRQLPVAKSLFPDTDLAPLAEALGYEAHTIRSIAQLEALAPLLANPDGPVFLDCKINADVAAPFMSEIAAAEAKHR